MGNVELQSEPLNRRGYLLKTDVYGNEIWSKYYGEQTGVGTVLYDAVQHANDWGFVLFGGIQTKGTTNDFYLLKTDNLGQTPNTIVSATNIDALPDPKQSLKITPNPNNGNFTLLLPNNLPIHETLHLSIYNIAGQKVFERPIVSDQLHSTLNLHLPYLLQGIYLVRLQSNTLQWQVKMVKCQ